MGLKKTIFKSEGKMFIYPGETASWHFLPLSKNVGAEIKEKFGKSSRGFGSLPVEVTIGETVWETSIFPVKQSGSYILPIKAMVRKKEDIEAGDEVRFTIKIRV